MLKHPAIIYGSSPPPLDWTMVGNVVWQGLGIQNFLSEPSKDSKDWIQFVFARLLVARIGPVLVSSEGPLASRLERARWLRIAQDADINSARLHAWPTLPVVSQGPLSVGSLAPELAIIGEASRPGSLPFYSKSGTFIFKALRDLGYDELSIFAANALDEDKHTNAETLKPIYDSCMQYETVWLSLGNIADEVLNGAGIKHIRALQPMAYFKTGGKETYPEYLKAQGLELGPYANQELPVCEPNHDILKRLEVPPPRSPKPEADELSSLRGGVSRVLAEKVRLKFVAGWEGTVFEASQSVLPDAQKSTHDLINKLAKAENWDNERQQWFDRRREKVKESSADKEATNIVKARQIVGDSVLKALTQIHDGLQSGDLIAMPKDAKALGDLWLQLLEKGDPHTDVEKQRLSSLPPQKFLEELRQSLQDNYQIGGETSGT